MIEPKHISSYPCEVIAVDEVGRGPLGGPVVIGAVRLLVSDELTLKALLRSLRPKGIKDSKKLTNADRLKVLKKLGVELLPYRERGATSIRGVEISYVTWDMCHETIDAENILAASLRGMREAALHLSEVKEAQTTVFIDGHLRLRWGTKKSPWTEVPLIKGDSKSLLIGMASIIAKEKRDAFMRDMHELYPQYGFASHFGYPTPAHKKAIKAHGPCPIHRKSFRGVKEHLRPSGGAPHFP